MWGRPTVCLITGASQNIGRAFAEELAAKVGRDSLFILGSRSVQKLGTVRQAVFEINPNVQVELVEWDLRRPDGDQYHDDLEAMLKASGRNASDFDLAVIVHNAATLGDLSKKVVELDAASVLQEELNVNVVSMLVLNSVFWKLFRDSPQKLIVNITADTAHTPTPSFGVPAIGKISRETALNVLAKESPEIKVLHFAPGPADTSLLQRIASTAHDPRVLHSIQEMYEQNKVVNPKEAIKAFVEHLQEKTIESGARLSLKELLQ